ncbi:MULTISPECIES: AAA family ATPase [unclassified Sporosarcina]|uniref:AAA family ATPase n=1 Tax=unclassified Sporosarcina TaxID=2647733 RepID=UPI001A91C39A|nr:MULTISPECIES: AAA family ATPase [unclassified Sporosarcina]MBO0588195.1 AAA family ATPase [Sporosarcina sp. E16_8]MBO0601949.1 AAA family ATPase [Sporosarcina sp. E16_3]
MKIAKITLNKMAIQDMKANLHQHVSSIEVDSVNNNYRVVFKDLDISGYILFQNDEFKAIHYCEANEKGVSCKHLNVFSSIIDTIGETLVKFSTKGSIQEIETIHEQLNDIDFTNVNSQFGLLAPIEEVDAPPVAAPVEPGDAAAPTTTTEIRDCNVGWGTVQTYLDKEGLPPALIHRVLERRGAIHATVSCLPMMIKPEQPHYPYSGPMLARALRHVLLGKDLILIGDKGTGKDTLIATIGWVLGLPQTIHVGNKDETKESIVGEPAFRDGESTFDLSQFASTVKNGGLANMAEVNMLMGDVTSVYHSLLDENRVLSSPVGAIKRHSQFLMIGSMNVGAGYAGVRALNDAFKDRFAVLRLPSTLEFVEMIQNKTGLHDRHGLLFLEKVKKAVDQLIQEESQGHAASTIRGYIDAARYFLENGITAETKHEIIEDYVLNKIEDLDEYMALRHMIRDSAWGDFPISAEEDEYQKGGY